MNSGGVGSGKTYSIVLKTIKLAIQYPGIFILVGAATFPLLRNTTLREFKAIVPDSLIKTYNIATSTFTLINGSEVVFRPLSDEKTLKSYNLGAAGVEEMTDISEEVYKILITRMRQPGMPGIIFGATNPGTFGNWVYQRFIDNPMPGSEVIYSISRDNPFLPNEYLQELEYLRESNPDYYSRMVEGRWGAIEGLVYNLPHKQRLSEEHTPKTFHKIIAGLDFGFNHPTAMAIIGLIEDRFYLIDEIYERNLTSGEIVKAVKEKCDHHKIDSVYCDPARPEIIEELRRAGVPTRPDVIKTVFDGIMTVKSLIGSGRFFVSNNCTFALREFDSYIWDKKSEIKEQPVKTNDDSMDAIRYALVSYSGIPVSRVRKESFFW